MNQEIEIIRGDFQWSAPYSDDVIFVENPLGTVRIALYRDSGNALVYYSEA